LDLAIFVRALDVWVSGGAIEGSRHHEQIIRCGSNSHVSMGQLLLFKCHKLEEGTGSFEII